MLEEFITTGDMARRIGVDAHRVYYAVEKADVEPVGKIGRTRVYRAAALDVVRAFIERTDEANQLHAGDTASMAIVAQVLGEVRDALTDPATTPAERESLAASVDDVGTWIQELYRRIDRAEREAGGA